MSRRFNDRWFDDTSEMSPEAFNLIVAEFDRAVDQLERFRVSWQEQVDLFNSNALKRFNDAVKPLVDRMQTAVEGGFLAAQTDDLVAIVEGADVSFFIPVEARVAFRPTPFLAIVAPDVREDWAIGRLLVYNEATGLLTVEILHLNGSGAERTGWTVAASSGVVEAVYQWMTETKAARDATIEATSQALTDIASAGALIISDAELARDEAVEAAEATGAAAILIAGGPVSSVNGRPGAVTGMLEQAGAQDITGLKTLKIGDSDDVIDWLRMQPTDYAAGKPMLRLGKKLASSTTWSFGLYDGTNNAGTLDIDASNFTWNGSKLATEAVAIETEKTFVASGAIATGEIVALRSDGKVEVVTGTETAAGLGDDAAFTASPNSPRFMNAAYNPASGKVAVIYKDNTAGNTILVVIGVVSGTAITWGAPQTFTGGQGSTNWDRGLICWNADGTTVIAVFKGASGYTSFVAATVSGASLAFGAVAQAGTSAFNDPVNPFFGHDDTHGSRVIFWKYVSGAPTLIAATYVGTTITVGAVTSFGSASGAESFISTFYDAPNARFILCGNSANITYIRCATVSGTTWTMGSEVSGGSTTFFNSVAVLLPDTGSLVLFGITVAGSLPAARMVTFSGTVVTFNSYSVIMQAPIGSMASFGVLSMQAVYEPTTGKIVVVAPHSNTTTLPGMVLFVGTISGTNITWTQAKGLKANGAKLKGLFARGSRSEVSIVYSDMDDFDRWHVKIGSVESGEFVESDDALMRSSLVSGQAIFIPTDSTVFEGGKLLNAGSAIIDVNHFGVYGSTASTTMTAFVWSLPTESTNADAWIGQAKETVADGATVKVKLRGSVASGLAGLTPGADYYLKGDASLITVNNGRPAGRALSPTELLMEAV